MLLISSSSLCGTLNSRTAGVNSPLPGQERQEENGEATQLRPPHAKAVVVTPSLSLWGSEGGRERYMSKTPLIKLPIFIFTPNTELI